MIGSRLILRVMLMFWNCYCLRTCYCCDLLLFGTVTVSRPVTVSGSVIVVTCYCSDLLLLVFETCYSFGTCYC